MKASVAVALVALVVSLAGTSQAQSFFSSPDRYKTVDTDKLTRNYLRGLSCGNEGVIESAMAQAVMAKLMRPEEEFEPLQTKLEALSVSGPTQAIRYKAYLASTVFANPTMFTGERTTNYPDGEALFTALAMRLQQTLTASNEAR